MKYKKSLIIQIFFSAFLMQNYSKAIIIGVAAAAAIAGIWYFTRSSNKDNKIDDESSVFIFSLLFHFRMKNKK